jgi:hypothetical protein
MHVESTFLPVEAVPIAGPIVRRARQAVEPPMGWWGRFKSSVESRLTRLAASNQFWHAIFAFFFLPIASKSRIRLGKDCDGVFETVLPFVRFNRNWYRAMGGAALLANAEIAGGMLAYKALGGDYTIVCKDLSAKFQRPCLGPAIYRVLHGEDPVELAKTQLEFDVHVTMDIVQARAAGQDREKRIGRATATFHVAHKSLLRSRLHRQKTKA